MNSTVRRSFGKKESRRKPTSTSPPVASVLRPRPRVEGSFAGRREGGRRFRDGEGPNRRLRDRAHRSRRPSAKRHPRRMAAIRRPLTSRCHRRPTNQARSKQPIHTVRRQKSRLRQRPVTWTARVTPHRSPSHPWDSERRSTKRMTPNKSARGRRDGVIARARGQWQRRPLWRVAGWLSHFELRASGGERDYERKTVTERLRSARR